MNSSSSNSPAPVEWPPTVRTLYDPIRIIGKGGFASVWMAKKKQDMTNNNNNGNSRRVVDNENDDNTVAIKIMRNDEYAKREIAILSELSLNYPHPNIVRLLQSFNTDNDDDNGVVDGGSKNGHSCCIVLSLAHGPTLNYIIHNYGALGFVIAQCISRQLISAVAFLHGHAVIHRDIQPCNIIVSGGVIHDDLWWSDELDVDGKLLRMARQCHITLIDFGFARALGRNDVLDDAGLKKVMDESYESFLSSTNQKVATTKDDLLGPCLIDQVLKDTSLSGLKSRNSGGKKISVFHDDSVSRKQILDLSAVGTRSYAAPEILSGIRTLADSMHKSLSGKQKLQQQQQQQEKQGQCPKKKKALSACVSNYGMVADAFSVGATIRHMVTGVPPSENCEEYIAMKNHPLLKLGRIVTKFCISKGLCQSSSSAAIQQGPSKKKYRTSYELPVDIKDLIHSLTYHDTRRRATVRSVTGHVWIRTSASTTTATTMETSTLQTNTSTILFPEVEHGRPIVYLDCGGK